MKITSPKEMKKTKDFDLKEALSKFEQMLLEEKKNQSYYHIVINGEYNRDICDNIEKLYTEQGWEKVTCKTSSENGERRGLTGLQLHTS